MGVKGAIGIKDNVTAVLQNVKKEQNSFRKDVALTKKAMEKAYDKEREVRVNTSRANKEVKKLVKRMTPLRNKLVKAVAIKDMTKSKIRKIKSNIKAVSRMSAKPVIGIKDKVAYGIGKIKGLLGGLLKTIAIPVTIATLGLGKSIQMGMKLEMQQVSMEHFIGATNKDMGAGQIKEVAETFMKDLRENANATPFETGEVIQAGSRSIAIASGDTKEAMSLVKLAEDMAAASGGTKDISQAIEALADAKMGEMERLKEFGFKVSAEEFKSKGFSGVAGDLSDFYGGASEKLATTGAGLMSTITGKLKSNISDMGLMITENLKPTLSTVIGFIDRASPYFEKFSVFMADKVNVGVGAITKAMPKIKDSILEVAPYISRIASAVLGVFSSAVPITIGLIKILGDGFSTILPVITPIIEGISSKIQTVTDFISSKMGFVKEVFDTVFPAVAEILSTAWTVIEPIIDIAISTFQILWEVVEFIFPAIQSTIKTVWGIIKPIVEGIGWVFDKVASGFSWIKDQVSGLNKDKDYKKGKNGKGKDKDEPKGSGMPKPPKDVYPMPKNKNTEPKITNKKQEVNVNIPKIADSIVIREEADIDKLGASLARNLKMQHQIAGGV